MFWQIHKKVATDLGQKEAWVKLGKHKEEDQGGKKEQNKAQCSLIDSVYPWAA